MERITEVFKIEIMVIDHDGIGKNELKSVIENTKYPNWCISPEVKKIETRSIKWNDDHPLNLISKKDEVYNKLFNKEIK